MAEIDEYDYHLPKELIAQHPLPHRTDARLLVVDRSSSTWEHAHIRDLPSFLRSGDVIVLNDTRVIPARLVGYRTQTGGKWSGLFLEADDQGVWKVIGQTRGRLLPGETVSLTDAQQQVRFELRMLAKLEGHAWAARPEVDATPYELLEQVGRVPLPPYIRAGEMEPADRQRYQTVYAERPGAVAAPTAGLHFTPALLSQLAAQGVGRVQVTLHVGQGTFQPVSVEQLADHQMHSEWGSIDESAVARLQECRRAAGRVVAVGTTAVRVLETAAQEGPLRVWQGDTRLFIRPPYEFRCVDALLTNFHLPKSTLLVLVRTFGGDNLMRRAYEEAIREAYRFYSYGDAMLIL